jgi:uncharacterized glyoxalase superfamily protein PhnB
MIKSEPIIAVADVERSSNWYQKLLGCNSGHGGDTFEMLTDKNGETFLCLHKWGEHEHPTLTAHKGLSGNGLVLYLKVEDLDFVWNNAQNLKAKIEEPPALNPNSGKQQFSLRDLDGYYLMLSAA